MTVTLIVLDSVGVGALPDATDFGDLGAHTLDHTLLETRTELPHFAALGLGCIEGVTALAADKARASYGRLAEVSPGKDTTTGHWEFMGVELTHAFKTFSRFPDEVMATFDALTGRGHLGNLPASGTAILDEMGETHLQTGEPIVYTSADSVFQVAAHVDKVPLATLYSWCEGARKLLQGEHAVARVIARPFTGPPGSFRRLGEARRDYSLTPPHETVLDALKAAGKNVIGVGKIPDIYSHQGFTEEVHTDSNGDGIDKTLAAMKGRPDGLIFCNLVEFDSLYGHRRDPQGYADALKETDARLPDLLGAVASGDWLLLVSDHGNDPTHRGTDHTREYGLLLAYSPGVSAKDLGTRESFADVGATVAELLAVPWDGKGSSFVPQLRNG
jgi:phosphopentomutase